MQRPMTQWWAPVVDNDDRVSYFYDYGIYAGFKGAKKGCMNTGSSKMMERSFKLTTSNIKVCLFRCSLGGFMENFFGGEMSYHQVSLCLFLRSYLNKLSNGTFITFYEHNWLFIISDSTNHSFNLKSRHAVQFTGEQSKLVATSDDDTLLNGLKYGWLPITGTFS